MKKAPPEEGALKVVENNRQRRSGRSRTLTIRLMAVVYIRTSANWLIVRAGDLPAFEAGRSSQVS